MATRRVLITGAGGFIGSHLVELTVQRGYAVRAFVHYNSLGTAGWLDRSPYRAQVEIVHGDVRDLDTVAGAVRGCDTVFHLAALIGIPYSYVSPLAYLRTNLEGTYNVLQAARDTGVGRVLITSTSETYGTAPNAQSPYAASKVGADQLALSFHRAFGLDVRLVRPFNTYGPRQSARAIIPTIVSQIVAGRTRLRLGNLEPTRDLTFVLDTVAGFLAIADCASCVGTATNIGVDEEISIRDLARRIGTLMEVEVSFELDPARTRPLESEVERLRCDNRRIRALTGWSPASTLDAGLRATIGWLRENVASSPAEGYAI
ncbi:MAG: SDR family NAD(P)-dependent oxidoreductase [Deltaproteobacteria bacterium]|nr:MAG: SDR family NAD(P)-dependent oxidoreductase [Deltaproteobacteria bacterium]